MRLHHRGRAPLAALLVPLLAGCAGRYFEPAAPPPAAPRFELAQWPWRELWSGIVFNGARIGFSRIEVAPLEGAPQRWEIRAEAALLLRFLGIEKKVALRSRDVVRADLSLERFAYDYNLDGHSMLLSGEAEERLLRVEITTGGVTTRQELPLAGPVYPTSAIALLPALQGLEVGSERSFTVYDGETQRIGELSQRIVGFEGSALFAGEAFKVVSRLHGFETTTWIDRQARPVFELGLNGVMVSALEPEAEARRYLVMAGLNKHEVLLDFSLIRTAQPIAQPRRVAALRLALSGIAGAEVPPQSAAQSCRRHDEIIDCELRRVAPGGGDPVSADQARRYLRASITVQSDDERIRALAQGVAGDAAAAGARVARLLDWIDGHIAKEAVDSFSAVDVLLEGRAECQGHSYLYAALARAAGIPTRVMNGLVYSEEHGGFLYHTWAESAVDGRWQPVDPTFGEPQADATHLAVVEGENLGELVPLMSWFGQVGAEVLEVSHDATPQAGAAP